MRDVRDVRNGVAAAARAQKLSPALAEMLSSRLPALVCAQLRQGELVGRRELLNRTRRALRTECDDWEWESQVRWRLAASFAYALKFALGRGYLVERTEVRRQNLYGLAPIREGE